MYENLINFIISSVNSILYIVMFYLVVDKIEIKKNINKKIDYTILILISIFIAICPKIYTTQIMLTIIIGIPLSILCKRLFEVSLKGAVIYGMTFSLGYSVIGSITSVVIQRFLINTIITYSPLNYKTLDLVFTNIVLLAIINILKIILNLNVNIKYYTYIALTIAVNILSIAFIYISGNHIFNLCNLLVNNHIFNLNQELIYFVYAAQSIIPGIIVICNMFLVIIINSLIKNIKSKSELKSINDKLDMQYNYYLNIEESHIQVRKLYHDINNHLANMKQLQNEDINIYIESVDKELKSFQSRFDTGNRILDIILNDKSLKCSKYDIDLFCDINFRFCDFVEMIDVSAIFANTLDNAIEACQKVKENRYIHIRGTMVKSYYIIKCESSKVNQIKIKNNKVITSKKNKIFHEIGLQSVKSSLKKYNGELKIIDEKNKFVLKIYIPLKNQ